jgi:hypothetical protein
MFYGKEDNLPTNIYLPSLHLTQAPRGQSHSSMQQRTDALIMLEEEREKEKYKFSMHRQLVKRWFDKHKDRDTKFNVGELTLKWDKVSEPKGNHSKFQILWLSPYLVANKIMVGTYRLKNMGGV